MTPTRSAILVLALTAFLPGCAAVGTLGSAATPLPTYELSPVLPDASVRGPSRGALIVEAPTAPASIATDRLVIRPGGNAVAVLPGARWSDSAPAQIQSLLTRTLAASGRFTLVTAGGSPVRPDTLLLTDLTAFEIAVTEAGPIARVAATLTLVREADRRILATRRIATSATAASTGGADAVAAFDAATAQFLSQAATFVIAR
jgi:cholesterol transport system auxiliary component